MLRVASNQLCGLSSIGGKPYSCRKSDCARCSKRKAFRVGTNIATHATNRSHLVHITLTWHGDLDHDELGTAARNMLKHFTAVRRRKAWRSVVGGARGMDASWNSRTNTYTPHLHVLAETDGCNPDDLRHDLEAEWGFHVHVNPVASDEQQHNTAMYVAKSLFRAFSKGNERVGSDRIESAVQRFKTATYKMHAIRAFGTWGKAKLSAPLTAPNTPTDTTRNNIVDIPHLPPLQPSTDDSEIGEWGERTPQAEAVQPQQNGEISESSNGPAEWDAFSNKITNPKMVASNHFLAHTASPMQLWQEVLCCNELEDPLTPIPLDAAVADVIAELRAEGYAIQQLYDP